jgi:hypothetical protein
MTDSQDVGRTPPAPRSLRTIRGARLELARLYAETKAGRVRPEVAGRLANMLGLMISSARDHDFERRVEELEQRLAEQHQPRPNESGYAARA